MTEAIPMLLWCPECRGRHIDEGEFATKLHHTHACQHCGHVWRPAVIETVGVRFLPGFKDATSPEELLGRIRQHPHVGAVVAQFETDMRDGLDLEEYDGESRDRSELWALLIELVVGAPPEAPHG